MEDPDPGEEWVIEGYSSEEESGKMSWILNKGLSVGKRILVAGFVISSAPLVLPPLVVISVIGFACSVPSGLFLASYACTDKLMSKLLPGSKPPLFLIDYETVSNDEEFENDENEGGDFYVRLKGDIDMGKGEEGMLEDTRENVEMRIELVNEKDNGKVYEGKASIGDEHEQRGARKDVNGIVEENGYGDDFSEYKDEMKEEPAVEIQVKIEGVRVEEEKEPVIEESRVNAPVDEVHAVIVGIPGDEITGRIVEEEGAPVFEVRNVAIEICQNNDIEEDEELVKETRGLLEKIREEGTTDGGKKDKQSLEKLGGNTEEADQKIDRNAEEFGMPFEDRKDYGNIGMEKPQGVIKPEREENNNAEIPKESSEMKEAGYAENVDAMPEDMKPMELVGGALAKMDVDNSLEAEKSTGEMVGTTNVGNTPEEEQKPNVEKPAVLQGERANVNISNNDVLQDYHPLDKERENLKSTNADAREIADESGFDLYDNRNAASQHYSYTDYDPGEENMKSSSYASLETTENTVLPVSSREQQSNRTTGNSSKKDFGMASSKVLYGEKKMWQQINAMRKIVGYKSAKHATCFEELKALYLFTGVEPPSSFKDPSDFQEMNDKLRFLMSIVGVK